MTFKYTLNAFNKQGLWEKFKQLDPTRLWVVDVKEFKSKRTLEQNALSHLWYCEICLHLDNGETVEDIKAYCKLHHGVPIMRRDDVEFREVYDKAIKGLTYEQKREIMKILPVTSLMKTAQLSEYLEKVQADFMNKGIMLNFPDGS